jgi:hypothetical protein
MASARNRESTSVEEILARTSADTSSDGPSDVLSEINDNQSDN